MRAAGLPEAFLPGRARAVSHPVGAGVTAAAEAMEVRGVKFTDYSDSQTAVAVRAFNARFGEMERVLWCLSLNSRAALLAGENSPVLEALVWAIKSWRVTVQGVRSETKNQMARALAESVPWSQDLFEPASDYGPAAADYACACVSDLVSRSMSMGVPRREYSLASKEDYLKVLS